MRNGLGIGVCFVTRAIAGTSTAAVLSGLGYAADLISVTTDTASGTIYYLLHNSVTPLSGAAIKSAVIGLTAVGGGTLDPLETDNQPVDWTAVTPATYWINMVQESTGGFSNVVSLEVTIIAAAFDPATVSGAQLVWDAHNIATLWQNTNGTSQVTATGQLVGSMTNRGSLGGLFTNGGGAARPVYTESGALKYLEFTRSNSTSLKWTGSNGDINLDGGYYLCIGVEELTPVADTSFLGGASLTGDSVNDINGTYLGSASTTQYATFWSGGLANANGVEPAPGTSPGTLARAVVEVEVTPASGSINARLRIRLVADGDVVEVGTDTANSGTHPNNATSVAQFILGTHFSGGSPSASAMSNCRIHCGVLVTGGISSTNRADCRLWVASRLGF